MAHPHSRRGCGGRGEGGAASLAPQCRLCLSQAGSRQMTGRFLLAALFSVLTLAPALILVAPVPARAADIKPLDLGKKAEVWFSEDHTVPIIAISITLPAGAALDPPTQRGPATLPPSPAVEG